MTEIVKNQPAMQETWVRSLGQKDPLEKEMTTHSSILAWRIPWTGKELDTIEPWTPSLSEGNTWEASLRGAARKFLYKLLLVSFSVSLSLSLSLPLFSLYLCLSVSPSLCLLLCLCPFLSPSLSLSLSPLFSLCLSFSLSAYLSISVSLHLSLSPRLQYHQPQNMHCPSHPAASPIDPGLKCPEDCVHLWTDVWRGQLCLANIPTNFCLFNQD